MMNLLTETEKKKVKSERIRRLLVVIGTYSSVLILIGVILMLPTYLSLAAQRRALSEQLNLSRNHSALLEVSEIEEDLEDFNKKMRLFRQGEGKITEVTPIIKRVLETRPDAISFSSLIYRAEKDGTPGRLIIQGIATRRQELLDFTQKLEKIGIFSKVDLPVANLLENVDLNFTLTTELIPKP